MRLFNLRKTTEREKDLIGLLQGYLGVITMTYWGVWCLNTGRLSFSW